MLKLIEQFKEIFVGKPKSLEEFWEDHVKLTFAPKGITNLYQQDLERTLSSSRMRPTRRLSHKC